MAPRTSTAKSPPTNRTPGDEPDQGYHIELAEDAGGRWTAQVAEMPDCTAQGDTADEAARLVQGLMRDRAATRTTKDPGKTKPRSTATHSGRLLIRMPQSLHAELAQAAERDDVSLNQFITNALSSAVSWRRSDRLAAEAVPGAAPRPAARKALVANVVLLAVIAVLAVVLLVVALGQL